jgi:ribokinase
MVVKTRKLPAPGETVLGENFFIAAGGKGANQAVAAARTRSKAVEVTFVARIGHDQFGAQALAAFKQEGLRIQHVGTDQKLPSGIAMITVDERGENCIVVASGANNALSTKDVDEASEDITGADIILLQLESPLATVQHAIELAFKAKRTIILNPAPARQLDETLLRQVSILTPNETEAEILTGIAVKTPQEAAKAATSLHQKGVPTVIITMGARGAFLSTQGMQEMIPAIPVKAIDTTAAGDVFNGSLAVGLAEKMPLPEAIRFACKAAAISVTRAGAQPSIPSRDEIID